MSIIVVTRHPNKAIYGIYVVLLTWPANLPIYISIGELDVYFYWVRLRSVSIEMVFHSDVDAYPMRLLIHLPLHVVIY